MELLTCSISYFTILAATSASSFITGSALRICYVSCSLSELFLGFLLLLAAPIIQDASTVFSAVPLTNRAAPEVFAVLAVLLI